MQPGRISRNALFPNFGQAVLLVIGMLVVQFGLGFGIGIVGAAVLKDSDGISMLSTNPWLLGLLNTAAIGVVLAFALRMTRERTAHFFSIRRFDLSLLPPIVLTSLSLAVVIDQAAKFFFQLMRFIPGLPVKDLSEELMATHPVGGFLLVVAVAPFTEEYLFRGMILRGLLTRHGVRAAVLVSAVLFGVMHANLLQLQLGLLTGCVFGWWYVRTGSVGPGLAGHAVFNAVAWSSTVFPLHFAPLGPSSGPDVVHQPAWFTLTAVAFAALGVWWFKGRADSLEELGVAGGWEDSIPEEPVAVDVQVLAPPLLPDKPPVIEPPVPPVLTAEPPLLKPPVLEPPVPPPETPVS